MPTDSREYWEAVPTDARAERYCAPRGAASEVVGVPRSVPAWSCVGPSALFFGTMVWADFLGARDCHVTPMPLALGIASRTPITLPANSPCTILIRAGKVVRDDLTVDIPRSGERRPLAGGPGWMVDRPRPGFKGGGRVLPLATRPIVSDPRDGDVSPAGDRQLGRRHRSGLCQVCAVQLDLQRSPSRICRKRRAPNFFAL